MQSMEHYMLQINNKIKQSHRITNWMLTQIPLRQQMAQQLQPQDLQMQMLIPAQINNMTTRKNSNNKCSHSNLTKKRKKSTNRRNNQLVQTLTTKTMTLFPQAIQQAAQTSMLIYQIQINKRKSNRTMTSFQTSSIALLFINKLMMTHLSKTQQTTPLLKQMLNPNKTC